MDRISKRIAYLLLIVSVVFFVILSFISEGSLGGADSFVHYRISRHSFKYPSLFLDFWGKPLFTILSSPFSQFGFIGIKIFNVCVAGFTAWFALRITEHLRWGNGYLTVAACLFAPVYFILIPSGMTELLFGLVLVFAIFLFFKEKYVWSAIVISFLPFARNEGMVILPFFLLAYLLKRNYRSIPFMASAFLFFSFIGWRHFGNLFWIFENNPYTGAAAIYGHGKMLHFVENYEEIFGWPLTLILLLGLISITFSHRNKKIKDNRQYVILLIVLPALTYFAAHSFVWWKGIGGSLGLTRVMAGIVPLVAIISVSFFSWKIWRFYLGVLITIAIIIVPFMQYDLPVRLDPTQKLVKKASEWAKDNKLDNRLIYYYDPMVCHFLKKDFYNNNVIREQIPDREHPENAVAMGALVFWDAHFGPNEGQMPIDRLLQNESFQLLKKFEPDQPFKVLNDYNYEIYIFEKVKDIQ
jgi:ABC-type cobalt transport system substrate-binding protein